MRKNISICLLMILSVLVLSSCGNREKENDPATDQQTKQTAAVESTDTGNQEPTGAQTNTPVQESTLEDGSYTVVQSSSSDLDGDGTQEKVEILQSEAGSKADQESGKTEGWLRIISKDDVREIPYINKDASLTGIMSEVYVKDLDKDGVKDVFITIPDTGASFTYNSFYMYNYKTQKEFSLNLDSQLADITGGFRFSYEGKGILAMKHEKLKFEGKLDLTDNVNFQPENEEANKLFESAWVDPVPVEIDQDSKLTLIDGKDGAAEIKVPLPIFGQAAVDIIGEVVLYFKVNDNFEPVASRYEVYDYSDGKKNRVGEGELR